MNKVQREIAGLQEKIMEVGGVKLRSQKSKVDGLRDQIRSLSDRIATSNSAKLKAEKDAVKNEKSIATSEKELEALQVALEELDSQSASFCDSAAALQKKYEDEEHNLHVQEDKLHELKENSDHLQQSVAEAKAKELKIRNDLEKYEEGLKESTQKRSHWLEKLQKLRSNINIESGNLEGDFDPLQEFTSNELEEFSKDSLKSGILSIEGELQNVRIDYSVLKEYKRRAEEHVERTRDFETSVNLRDEEQSRCDDLRKKRLQEFMDGLSAISLRLKEMYQVSFCL